MAENKSNGGAIAIGVASVLLVGVAIYFVVKGIKVKPKAKPNNDGERSGGQNSSTQSEESQSTSGGTSNNPFAEIFNKFKEKFSSGDSLGTFTEWSFPIRRSQKNSSVKELQNLLLKYDNRLLPKFGADGFFGSETETALVKVLGKNKVSSQSDIDALKDKISTKASQIAGAFAINQSLGIKIK